MFNEILTGKASLEDKPRETDPYRQESVPEISVICASCRKSFTTKVNSGAVRCSTCHLAFVQANSAQSARALADANDWQRRDARSSWLLKTVVIVVCSIGLAILKSGMRKDMGSSARYSSYHDHPYSRRIDQLSSEMCGCRDRQCARGVERRMDHYLRTDEGSSPDPDAADAAERSLQRYAECMAALETTQ